MADTECIIVKYVRVVVYLWNSWAVEQAGISFID